MNARSILSLAVLALLLLLLQVTVLNNVCLFNVAVPVMFVLALWKLPVTLHTNWVLTIAFLLGLLDDVFADTYGMNALCCTVCAFVRRPVLRLYLPRDDELPSPEPSCASLGPETFAKYLFTMTLLYCAMFFVIEAFTFFNPLLLLARIVCSSLLSFALMFALDSIISRRRSEKRL